MIRRFAPADMKQQSTISQGSATLLNHNVARGILMLAVILDHNDIIRNVRSVNNWFLPMTFHVAGFLLLPFLMPPKRLSLGMARDHAVRYLVPFFFFLLSYAIAFQVLIAKQTPAGDWLKKLAIAFLFADPWSLQASTGFVVLWFLPALLSLVLLAALFNSGPAPLRAAILAFAISVHLTIGAAPVSVKTAVPQGLLIAFYMLPLGLAVRYALPWLVDRKRRAWVAAAALAGLLASWTFELRTEVEIATLIVPTLLQPLWVIATDLSDLSFLIILIVWSPMLARIPGLALLGQYSLLIYLFHPILYKPILKALLQYCILAELATSGGTARYWAGAAASVVSVSAISLAASATVRAWPLLGALVTPRDFQNWLPVAACRTAWSRFA